MAGPLAPELNEQELARRQRFFGDRAKAHDGAEDGGTPWHAACAACLAKEAAAVAILRGRVADARKLLRDAGERFSALGLFAGLPLLEFSRPGEARRWRSERQGFDARVGRLLASGAPPEETDEAREPFLEDSANSPRQLLHLYQSERLAGGDPEVAGRVRDRFRHLGEAPVGPAQMPLGDYVELLDEVAGVGRPPRVPSARTHDILLSMILKRRERLDGAKRDTWHWKMLMNPSELVDFDLLAIAAAMGRTGSRGVFADLAGPRGDLVLLPLRAAELLQGGFPDP